MRDDEVLPSQKNCYPKPSNLHPNTPNTCRYRRWINRLSCMQRENAKAARPMGKEKYIGQQKISLKTTKNQLGRIYIISKTTTEKGQSNFMTNEFYDIFDKFTRPLLGLPVDHHSNGYYQSAVVHLHCLLVLLGFESSSNNPQKYLI